MGLIVCMGVSGIGKSTVTRELAQRLGGTYLDADDFHSSENKQKMAQGIALTDADRWGWLDALNREVAQRSEISEAQRNIFLACSALKQSYRERLTQGLHGVTFVYLKAPFSVVQERLRARPAHFMAAELLASQFATLEEPAPGAAVVVDAVVPLPELIDRIVSELRAIHAAVGAPGHLPG